RARPVTRSARPTASRGRSRPGRGGGGGWLAGVGAGLAGGRHGRQQRGEADEALDAPARGATAEASGVEDAEDALAEAVGGDAAGALEAVAGDRDELRGVARRR